MPVRISRKRIPILLICIPAVWLIVVISMSFRFEEDSKQHKHVRKSNARGLLPSLVFEENGEINAKIRKSGNVNPLELEDDVRREFELEDQLELQQRENEMQLKELMNLEEDEIKDKLEIVKKFPVHFNKQENPFMKRLENNKINLNAAVFNGQINSGSDLDGKLKIRKLNGSEKLGENGVPIFVKQSELNEEEQTKYSTGMKIYKFNEFISNTISLNRTLPDLRNPLCRKKQYEDLPQVSIIITFYNEAWSTLLRTLYSAINRAPKQLIYEILLIDDHSNLEHLKTPLEDYLKIKLPIVKIIRSETRLGLVRARLVAVEKAHSGILVFLDSHIECFEGWLEPLITPLLENPHTIATPIIEMIDYETFGLANSGEGMIGTFNLPTMMFDWSRAPRRIVDMRRSMDDYYMSPTMAGGLFSIRKDYFKDLGGYDEKLELWGSENLELSFKTWMCGGRILINPCSHIGHIFRPQSPYLNDSHRDTLIKNKARVAEVWLDDYKDYFIEIQKVNQSTIGDISAQKQLKSDLNCNDFDWYINNIYPELYVPGVGRQFGELLSEGTKYCLIGIRKIPRLVPCEVQHEVHAWDSGRIDEIRYNDRCMDVDSNYNVMMSRCSGEGTTQAFTYTKEGYIVHTMTKLCLTAVIPDTVIFLKPCIYTIMQAWGWSSNPNSKPLGSNILPNDKTI